MENKNAPEWYYAAPPDGQWARPGTVDGPIGRFLLPIGGGSAEVARKFYFLINSHGQTVFWPRPAQNEA